MTGCIGRRGKRESKKPREPKLSRKLVLVPAHYPKYLDLKLTTKSRTLCNLRITEDTLLSGSERETTCPKCRAKL